MRTWNLPALVVDACHSQVLNYTRLLSRHDYNMGQGMSDLEKEYFFQVTTHSLLALLKSCLF
jgi:hypothetical protein